MMFLACPTGLSRHECYQNITKFIFKLMGFNAFRSQSQKSGFVTFVGFICVFVYFYGIPNSDFRNPRLLFLVLLLISKINHVTFNRFNQL